MHLKHIFTLSALFISLLSSYPASAFTWGVGGHQIWGGGVWANPEAEFVTMKQYGLTTYRFDVPLTDDRPDAAADVQNLITLAAKYGITLHPILYVPFTYGSNITDSGRYPATNAGLEQQGYNRVYPFVLQFASQIHDWELENELSLVQGVKNGIGISASNYNTTAGLQWASVIKGMSAAVHDVQAKTGQPLRAVVDTTYVDFGLIPFLEQNGASIDKVAYHYYYNVDTSPYQISAPDGTLVDIFFQLSTLGKPVIINEFNAAEIYAPVNTPPQPYNDAQALASLKKHIGYITQQTEAHIEGVEFYELYNDPNASNAAESNFGLMLDATHTKTQMLLAAVYACGTLSNTEESTLVSSGLFTSYSLDTQRLPCIPVGIHHHHHHNR